MLSVQTHRCSSRVVTEQGAMVLVVRDGPIERRLVIGRDVGQVGREDVRVASLVEDEGPLKRRREHVVLLGREARAQAGRLGVLGGESDGLRRDVDACGADGTGRERRAEKKRDAARTGADVEQVDGSNGRGGGTRQGGHEERCEMVNPGLRLWPRDERRRSDGQREVPE